MWVLWELNIIRRSCLAKNITQSKCSIKVESSPPPGPQSTVKSLSRKRMITQWWFPKDLKIKGGREVLREAPIKTVTGGWTQDDLGSLNGLFSLGTGGRNTAWGILMLLAMMVTTFSAWCSAVICWPWKPNYQNIRRIKRQGELELPSEGTYVIKGQHPLVGKFLSKKLIPASDLPASRKNIHDAITSMNLWYRANDHSLFSKDYSNSL